MRTWLKAVPHKLASLPVIRWRFWRESLFSPFAWQFWHEERWQKNAKWSASSWIVMTILFVLVVSKYGHGLRYLIVWTIVTDVVNYVVKKRKIFPDRKVSYSYSGGASAVAAIFWFTFHKGTTLLLIMVFGLGIYVIRGIQGVIGVLENPLDYKFSTLISFAETRNKTEKA